MKNITWDGEKPKDNKTDEQRKEESLLYQKNKQAEEQKRRVQETAEKIEKKVTK